MSYDLKDQLTIQEGTFKEYKVLDDFHYLNTPLPPYKQIYTIRPKLTELSGHTNLIGVIVYSCPLRALKARTRATSGYFDQPTTLSAKLKLLNKHILYICRVVIDPRYRRLGLADWLMRETLKLQTVPVIESMTPLPVRTDWFESLGFQIFYNPTPQYIRKLKKAFAKAHIDPECWNCPEIAQKRIDALISDDKIKLNRSLHHFLSNYRHHEHMPDDIKRTTYILSKLPYPNGYLIWLNPHITNNPVLDWINERKTR